MPERLLPTPKWLDSLVKLIESIGSSEFYPCLRKSLQGVSPYEITAIMAYEGDNSPFTVFYDFPDKDISSNLSMYTRGGFFLDPFYQLHVERKSEGLYHLSELAPDEFYQTDYYKNYASFLSDEIAFLIRFNDDCNVLICMGVRAENGKPSSLDLIKMQSTAPIMAALCHKHWKNVGLPFPRDNGNYESHMGIQLTKAFQNFATDFLSERECQIVRLILKGFSSKAIAQLLEISPDTVKVHRKHIHNKLDVNSQSELFSLFLTSLSLVEIGSDVDPLTLYYA